MPNEAPHDLLGVRIDPALRELEGVDVRWRFGPGAHVLPSIGRIGMRFGHPGEDVAHGSHGCQDFAAFFAEFLRKQENQPGRNGHACSFTR